MADRFLTRRDLIQRAAKASALLGVGVAYPRFGLAAQSPPGGRSTTLALALAQFLNRTKYSDLPPLAIEHAKMILASTFASAAPGALIGSARIVRDLAKAQGGKEEATIWFDGAKLPSNEAARVNAMLSDAAASDDSDLRNVAHIGTTLTAVGLDCHPEDCNLHHSYTNHSTHTPMLGGAHNRRLLPG